MRAVGRDGTPRSTAKGIRNLLGAIVHADQVGPDCFGVGEHHTVSMPASPPGTLLAADAAATSNIVLGSAASIISTDDPVRVFQQLATADAISGGGRVEITAGRGSSVGTFPLFGSELRDYDRLYSKKLELLMALNNAQTENVSWSGTVRLAIDNLAVVPRPVRWRLPLWIATRGSPALSTRRCQPCVVRPGGAPAPAGLKESVAALGLVAPSKKEALERFYPGWCNLNLEMGRLRGWPAPDRGACLVQTEAHGAYHVGDPDEVAERMVHLHGCLGHMRHFLQGDIGWLPHEHLLESITLLATSATFRLVLATRKPL